MALQHQGLAPAPTLQHPFNPSSNKAPLLLRNGVHIGSSRGVLDLSREASMWSKEAIPWGPRRGVAASVGRIAAVSQNRKSRILVKYLMSMLW